MKFCKKLVGEFINKIMKLRILHYIPDKMYIQIIYFVNFHKMINLNNPTTFNEKLQWLKLHDHNPKYTNMVDKYEAKKIVANKIGDEYIIPTLGIWNSFDEIDFNKLPNQFVLKCTHDCGGIVICKDQRYLNIRDARNKINKSMKRNYYYVGREWQYKNVKPRIIAERYMVQEGLESGLNDYKFQCFDGKVDNIMICEGRDSERGVRYLYFSKEWNYLGYCLYDDIDISTFTYPKPDRLNEMIQIAETLAEGYKELRIDLYCINGKIYFGEITLYTSSGIDRTITREADRKMGERLNLKTDFKKGDKNER